MDGSGFLASAHRSVVDEFIEAVLDELACDMADVERNVLGVALRSEVETRLVPELLAIHALLLGADAKTLARLPEWLELTSVSLPSDAAFFNEMSRRLDPAGYEILEENLSLLPGESATSRPYTDCLWSVVRSVPDNS